MMKTDSETIMNIEELKQSSLKLAESLRKEFGLKTISQKISFLRLSDNHGSVKDMLFIDSKCVNFYDYLTLKSFGNLDYSGSTEGVYSDISELYEKVHSQLWEYFDDKSIKEKAYTIGFDIVGNKFSFLELFNECDDLFKSGERSMLIKENKDENLKQNTWEFWRMDSKDDIDEFIEEIAFEYMLNDIISIRENDNSAAYLVADVSIPATSDYTGVCFKFSSLNKDKEFIRNIDEELFFNTQQMQFFAMNEFYKENENKIIDSIRLEILDPTVIHSQDEYDLDDDNGGSLWNDTVNKNFSFDIKYVE